ncbi:MAG: hypothetical protein EOO07_13580 [Chitinophagaceae bacterium]|nr:MAG: hypothetical protein EOO07_13580 [Chitinophagaceae bacterium]
MYPLPSQEKLKTNLLAGSFNHTSATYKFYWFLAILDEVEMGQVFISKQVLFARMIANAWYTVNYFHVSFGVQDQIQRAIFRIKQIEGLAVDEKRSVIVQKLITSASKETSRELWYFDGEVPYRFLSPWFTAFKGNKQAIYTLSRTFENDCLYSVDEKELIINPRWVDYLAKHAAILRSFCYWHLSLYLQKFNPNVPDIPNKLIRPAQRSGLTKQRKEFWDVVIKETGPVNCIYTQRQLDIGNYAVEHFLPYAFVSHDLIWNLIPADKAFNSSKSDKLPIWDRHFEPYFQLQKKALKTFWNINPGHKLLEDYLPMFPNLSALKDLDDTTFRTRFEETVQPLITIASNNGFEGMR